MRINEYETHDPTAIRLKSVPGVLAIGLMLMVAATSFAVFFVDIPQQNQTIIGQLIGTELSLLGVAVAYFYGSSAGNRRNQDTMALQAESMLAAQTTLSSATPSGGTDTMSLKPGELAVAVGSVGGGAEITKEGQVLDAVLDNLAKDPTTLDKTVYPDAPSPK